MQLVDALFVAELRLLFSPEEETSGIDECNCLPADASTTFDKIDIEMNDLRDFLSLSSTRRILSV